MIVFTRSLRRLAYVIVVALAVLIAVTSVQGQTKRKPKKKSAKPTPAVVKPQESTPPNSKQMDPAGSTDPANCPGPSNLGAAERIQLLEAHNKVRAEHGVSPLAWNCRIADYAHDWASRGVFEHRTDSFYGESIFVSSRADEPVASVLAKWMLEKAFWDNALGVCETGKVCTHFTQAVWKETKELGCAINRNMSGRWTTMVVCNYSPAGNNRKGPAY